MRIPNIASNDDGDEPESNNTYENNEGQLSDENAQKDATIAEQGSQSDQLRHEATVFARTANAEH